MVIIHQTVPGRMKRSQEVVAMVIIYLAVPRGVKCNIHTHTHTHYSLSLSVVAVVGAGAGNASPVLTIYYLSKPSSCR